jgi:predicted Na+-dependent transporter
MSEMLQTIATLSVLVFVVASMLAMGLSLSLRQILDPLADLALVGKALLANFVVVPALVFLIVAIVPVTEAQKIGLLLLATAAGAPFLPKLVAVAKGDLAYSVGLMVLLMIVTVVYVPVVLPQMLPGIAVNPLDIASSLIVLMLIPLAIGLFIQARYSEIATSLQPVMAQASNTALIFLAVLGLLLNFNSMLGLIGTGAIIALFLLILGAFGAGWLLGGPHDGTRPVMGLGTAQRNISAALVVAGQNFQDPDVITLILVGSIVMLVVLMLISGELGRRTGAPGGTSA